MISLVQLLKEIQSKPKAIIMAGGASVGKSTILNSLNNTLKGFENLNADKYVEDKKSPSYGNLAAAASQIKKVDLPNAINDSRNLIYDTTASTLSSITPVLDALKNKGYDVMMIMVYAHPMVSFLRNFKRERKVPAVGVLSTWVNTYNLIDEYKQMFGDNFILVSPPNLTPEEQSEINKFQSALNSGKLNEYFENLLSSDQFQSTFRKSDDDLSPEEKLKREKQRNKTKEIFSQTIKKIEDTFDNIQSSLSPIDIKQLPLKVKKFIE